MVNGEIGGLTDQKPDPSEDAVETVPSVTIGVSHE
jgi:hypothetical protein